MAYQYYRLDSEYGEVFSVSTLYACKYCKKKKVLSPRRNCRHCKKLKAYWDKQAEGIPGVALLARINWLMGKETREIIRKGGIATNSGNGEV